MTAVDNLNRATTISGVNRTYDILGNTLTIGSTKSMTWDALNRMLSYTSGSTTTDYQYRADGMRTKKIGASSTDWFYYDGQMPIETAEVGSSSTVVTRNGLGARGIDRIERVGTSTTVGYPIYDGHGNMIATLAKSGSSFTLGDARTYDAWGAIRSGNTTGDPKGRYCANLGHVDDDESSLTYMRARYYEPGSGRFISQDPEFDGWNAFSYCRNDPENYTDRDGKFIDILLGMGIGALVGLISGLISITGQAMVAGISAHDAAMRLLASTLSGGVGGAVGTATKVAALGSAASAFVNSILSDLFAGRAIRWGKAFVAAGVGGAVGGALAWASGVSARAGMMKDLAVGGEEAFDRALALFGGLISSNALYFVYN